MFCYFSLTILPVNLKSPSVCWLHYETHINLSPSHLTVRLHTVIFHFSLLITILLHLTQSGNAWRTASKAEMIASLQVYACLVGVLTDYSYFYWGGFIAYTVMSLGVITIVTFHFTRCEQNLLALGALDLYHETTESITVKHSAAQYLFYINYFVFIFVGSQNRNVEATIINTPISFGRIVIVPPVEFKSV